MSVFARNSALSDNVRRLLCYSSSVRADSDVVRRRDETIFLDLKRLRDVVDSEKNWEINLANLFSTLKTCDRHFQSKNFDFSWSISSKVFTDALHFLNVSSDVDVLLALLLTTSAIEKTLRDVYASLTERTAVPLLLKDLLLGEKLEMCLGKAATYCLRLFIGPPGGLNLRNLAWHGFLAPRELHKELVSFLLTLAASLPLKDVKICWKPFIKFRDFSIVSTSIPPLHKMNLSGIYKVIQTAPLIQDSMKDVCIYAVRLLTEKKPWFSIALLLPQLEHCLRRLFAFVNNCPSRILTAEATSFYTTFDEPVLADNSPNNLFVEVDETILTMFLDLLVHADGPRLRDRVSHGDVDIYSIPFELGDWVLTLFIALCFYYPHEMKTSMQDDDLRAVLSSKAAYKSLFHPLAIAKRQAASLFKPLLCAREIEFPPDFDPINFTLTNGIIEIASENSWMREICRGETTIGNIFRIFQRSETLRFCKSKENSQIVSTVRKITDHLSQTVKQILAYASERIQLWRDKQLRSSRRETYKRFSRRLPAIVSVLEALYSIALLFLLKTEQQKSCPASSLKYLKQCLQSSENLASLTSVTDNKWEDAAALADKLLEQTHKHNFQK
ncbi:endoplasmic reticulum membrane-associated RNA degradation protein-like isoform X2 [Oscarella lobularis]|uniref:endoplasmic reticulum membrane-associated RNA degradation protein-like isoform X2 n=1 Tax=Oscarella lobularis TaxID=121494 RepID=UPI0033135685